jgi:hypothetical protein
VAVKEKFKRKRRQTAGEDYLHNEYCQVCVSVFVCWCCAHAWFTFAAVMMSTSKHAHTHTKWAHAHARTRRSAGMAATCCAVTSALWPCTPTAWVFPAKKWPPFANGER